MSQKERLKKLRSHFNLTQKELGESVGTTQNKIKDIETDRQNLPIELAQKVKEVYNISFEWLLTGEGEMILNSNFDCHKHYIEQLKQKFNLNNEEIELIISELLSSPATKDAVLKLLKAKKGNKEAFKSIKEIVTGLEMTFE